MARAIMTQEAIDHLYPQEHASQVDGMTVVSVLCGSHCNRVAEGPIRFSLRETIARCSDHLASYLVVGLVTRDCIFNIEVEGIASGNRAIDALRLCIYSEEISEKHRPLIDEFGGADERIYFDIPLRWIRIVDECIDFRARWNSACQVESDASKEFCIGRDRCRADSGRLHSAKNGIIDEVLAGYRDGINCGEADVSIGTSHQIHLKLVCQIGMCLLPPLPMDSELIRIVQEAAVRRRARDPKHRT